MDLASRDVVSRAIATEIKEGRGVGKNADTVLLKLDHLGEDVIKSKLPGIREIAKNFANIDPIKDPIPVVPTCHYMMGGIPTNIHGQVVDNAKNRVVNGLYAVGECACVSVHGANRLGSNSLLDLMVFGRAAGDHMADYSKKLTHAKPLPVNHAEQTMTRLFRLENGSGESVSEVGDSMRRIMQAHCGVFRFPELLDKGAKEIKELAIRENHIRIKDKNKIFNTARIEALELDNLIEVAKATMLSAQAREESRGAHCREDFPERNDETWLKHTLFYSEGNVLDYKPVVTKPLSVETFPLKARVY